MGPSAALQLDHKSGISQAYRVNNSSRPAPLYATNTVWTAFQDGMKILDRYARRSGANSTLIAKANLRLLHDTLLDDPSYRERLTLAKNEMSKNGFSTAYNLFNTQGMCADLITLQPSCDTELSSNDRYNFMYMLIYGKVAVNHATDSQERNNQPDQHLPVQRLPIQRKPWWKRFRYSSNKNVCKQGDVILFGQNDPVEKILSAFEHHCVLLRISLPVFYHQADH